MRTLRLTQAKLDGDRYRVNVSYDAPGGARLAADAELAFAWDPQDREDVRWYLEDYLEHPHEPAPTVAARVERRMAKVGVTLFEGVFEANEEVRDIWAEARKELADTRVEVVTDVAGATALPWELLRDPETDTPLALSAHSFVRAQPKPTLWPELAEPVEDGRVRVLLVLCRPGGEDDVPFRSVASKLIMGLSEEAREGFELVVLRPPTFERLGEVLRGAKDDRRPFHVVHFDGHGAFMDLAGLPWRRFYPHRPRPGARGYLVFEDPDRQSKQRLVDGTELGQLLAETRVPALVLNACRSAFAEAPSQPDEVDEEEVREERRAFGSLAQEVMDAGALAVVAMRYNVWVVTAAELVANLYANLGRGRSLGEAVTLGRKQLAAEPERRVGHEALPLQDWSVPVVWEAAPIELFPRREADESRLEIDVEASSGLSEELKQRPLAGFFGRDETLLALDRAFDSESIVLLHAYAGSGKTETAKEFARWYAMTGGVESGVVLFTTFEHYQHPARVLDQIGAVFGPMLEQAGVHWLALEDAQRREVALKVLAQLPVLWIWDNVEPVAGFPAGAESAWSPDEQQELADFLRAASRTKAKVLLTSRRDERGWLGDLPKRVQLPPMPPRERIQLAKALAERRGQSITDIDAWRPLLDYSGGNPLTLTVLVGQALRDRRDSAEQVEAFVEALRRGEADLVDDAAEGRSKSLAASLSYGFEAAFDEQERVQLAVLHLFQGFVDVDALCWMGNPDRDWCLPELRGLTREQGIAFLGRAAETGLLAAFGGGYYRIHPALPWYFRDLFAAHHLDSGGEGQGMRATRAFVEAMGELGNYYAARYDDGDQRVIGALGAEEANLLHARRLARANEWWDPVTSAMQGLRQLYHHTGRRADWTRLVEEIIPDFVDPETDGSLPEREEDWCLVTEYRVRIEMEARRWAKAERLQRVLADWSRRRAESALSVAPEALDDLARNRIRMLGVSSELLGHIQREQGKHECVETFEEVIRLFEGINAQREGRRLAQSLGNAYEDLPGIRDLQQAERWYRRSLDFREERDHVGRAGSLAQLGSVAFERFQDAREGGASEDELLRHLNAAVRSYHEALALYPPDVVDCLATVHNQLGEIYRAAGDVDRALPHYRESIGYKEQASNLYGAAGTRFNLALALAAAGRFHDALLYAQTALRNFQTFGDRAVEMLQRTTEIIAAIQADLATAEPEM